MVENILLDPKSVNPVNMQSTSPDARSLLLEALENSWRNYLAQLKRCQAEFSNEAVHDLRVTTRRAMAVIQLLNSITPRPRYQKIVRAFKEQLDEFDDLRDTQVILAEISETLHELPELAGFQRSQQALEEKLLRGLRKQVRKFSLTELSRRIRKTHVAIQSDADDLESQILQAVDDAFLLTRQRLAWVDLSRPATIHKVRIVFKSFRYMVEIMHPLLEEFPEVHFEWMSHYQSLMGEVQDAEVFMQTLSESSGSASLSDLDSIRRYYEHRHAQAIAAFADDMHQLQLFWRAAPDQPFPWEKTL